MSACEFKDKCPVFKRFKHEGIKSFWLNRYCDKGGHDCKRKELRESGKGALEVPVSMLPNGKYLDILEVIGPDTSVRVEDDCQYAFDCAGLFDRFVDPDSRNFWSARYCFKKGEGCYRREMLENGRPASNMPANLLPNGQRL